MSPSRILLFGSRAKGTYFKGSDFDIAVDGRRPDAGLEMKISEAMEAMSGFYKVDVVYLEDVDKEFKEIILETGKVLYDKKGNGLRSSEI